MRRQLPRNAGIKFIHNHITPLGQLLRGGHLPINDVCHLWIFYYNGRNLKVERYLLVKWKFSCNSMSYQATEGSAVK